MFYHRLLKSYSYSLDQLKDIIDYSEKVNWSKGVDNNAQTWNVEELELKLDQFEFLSNLYNSVNVEFKKPYFYLSKVLPGGLVSHIDHRKWCNLGFPISGFENTKLIFIDQFNQVVEEIDFNIYSGLEGYIKLILMFIYKLYQIL